LNHNGDALTFVLEVPIASLENRDSFSADKLVMKMIKTAFLLSLVLSGITLIAFAESKPPELMTVPRVDLTRYVGHWYEIAKYPNRFERDCDRDIKATYSRVETDEIDVVNACIEIDGKQKISKGKAKVVDDVSHAKLKVTFFWPFYGDYWVIDLDPDYRWVVVGEPRRKYLWIMSREPHMDAAQYAEITSRLAAKGYDPSKLVPVKHTNR
jgi:apolipoprotein D and lipocalin family protein